MYRTDARTVAYLDQLEAVRVAAEAFLQAISRHPPWPLGHQEALRQALARVVDLESPLGSPLETVRDAAREFLYWLACDPGYPEVCEEALRVALSAVTAPENQTCSSTP
jgi:hypothetical protein